MVEEGTPIRVSCRDCSFERVLPADSDTKPADTLIEHGQRTGHTLTVTPLER